MTRFHESSDEKVRVLLACVTGPDFRHRLDSILDAFSLLREEQEHQKRVMTQSWAYQEKAVRCLTDNVVVGLNVDFAGLAALPASDDKHDDDDDHDDAQALVMSA